MSCEPLTAAAMDPRKAPKLPLPRALSRLKSLVAATQYANLRLEIFLPMSACCTLSNGCVKGLKIIRGLCILKTSASGLHFSEFERNMLLISPPQFSGFQSNFSGSCHTSKNAGQTQPAAAVGLVHAISSCAILSGEAMKTFSPLMLPGRCNAISHLMEFPFRSLQLIPCQFRKKLWPQHTFR